MRSLSPSILNFGAGLLAGAGINLLTSLAGGSDGPRERLVLDALLWIAAAAAVTWNGHLVDTAVRTADLYINANLPPEVQHGIRRAELDKVAGRLRWSWALAALCATGAVLLLPGLVR